MAPPAGTWHRAVGAGALASYNVASVYESLLPIKEHYVCPQGVLRTRRVSPVKTHPLRVHSANSKYTFDERICPAIIEPDAPGKPLLIYL